MIIKIKEEKRLLFISINLIVIWIISLLGNYILTGEFPNTVTYLIGYPLITGIISLPVSLMKTLNSLFPFIDLFNSKILSYIAILIGILYWPTNIFMLYRFWKYGSLIIYLIVLGISLLSGFHWHFWAAAMSGI